MTLDEIKRAIIRLTPEELVELREYIEFRRPHPLPPEERIRRMKEAAAFIRESMTPEQLDEAIAAMNEEYIESWDEAEWKF